MGPCPDPLDGQFTRRRFLAASAGVGFGVYTSASGATLAAQESTPAGTPIGTPVATQTVAIADTGATAETLSLFSYLNDTRGKGVLFGHQHTIDNGITFIGPADGEQSDILAAVGDYPAIFGWDTLILEGLEGPGKPGNTPQQNVDAFRSGLQQAHRLGGISTISAHMKNFVTGNDFHDASGRVVSHILPGGDKHAEFNAYLDLIADLANTTTDDIGALIPLVFRPFHENTGSWFWWGVSETTAGEYKEIFRYTVEYLRDTKGVSNLLYAYSPNASFGADPENYMKTYPGDAWVDILGYDSYESDDSPENSDAWIASAVVDLAMVSNLADEHGKIAAFTEFGRNGDRTIKPSGNKSLNYFTDLLNAIRADPKGKRIAYMQTWANWELDQFYVPYPAYADGPAHEMLPDFQAYYDDDYSVFAGDIPADVYATQIEAAPAQPALHLVTPADGQRINMPSTTVRAKVLTADPDQVFFKVEGDSAKYDLTLGADGYFTAEWGIGEENLTNQTTTITVSVVTAGQPVMSVDGGVVLGDTPVLPLGVVDDFEGYGDDGALQAEYGVDTLVLSTKIKGSGTNAAQFRYDFTNQDYTGFGKSVSGDWSGFKVMSLWLKPDGSNQKLVLQVVAGGASFEAYPSLAGTEPTQVSIPFADFRPAPWDTENASRRLTATELAQLTDFNVFINKVPEGTTTSGSVLLDDIRALASRP